MAMDSSALGDARKFGSACATRVPDTNFDFGRVKVTQRSTSDSGVHRKCGTSIRRSQILNRHPKKGMRLLAKRRRENKIREISQGCEVNAWASWTSLELGVGVWAYALHTVLSPLESSDIHGNPLTLLAVLFAHAVSRILNIVIRVQLSKLLFKEKDL